MKKTRGSLIVTLMWAIALATSGHALRADEVGIDDFAGLPEEPAVQSESQGEEGAPEADVGGEPVSAPAVDDGSVELRVPVSPPEVTDDRVTLSFVDEPIADVINMFTRIPGVRIVTSVQSDRRVTVSLYDTPWRDALESILDTVDLVLLEKRPGTLTIISKEDLAAEPVVSEGYRVKFLTSGDVLPIVSNMLVHTNGSVSTAPNNMLVIQETVDRISRIKDVLDEVDQPKPQVFIEAKFVELNEQAIKDLGINWRVLEGYRMGIGNLEWGYDQIRVRDRSRVDASEQYDRRSHLDQVSEMYDMQNVQYEDSRTTYTETPPGSGLYTGYNELVPTRMVEDRIERGQSMTSNINDSTQRVSTEARGALLTADQLEVTLSALQQNDGISIVSNPKIIVSSGETATIHVGRQDPEIRAVADTNLEGRLTYQRAAWIESGVRLEVSPVVNTEDNISLHIMPTLSRVIDFAESGDVRVRIPILSTRTIDSRFNLTSGMTAAIGGLTETRDHEQETKVPLLGDIPIIGRLFRHNHTERVQDEIIIFVSVEVAEPTQLTGREGIPGDGRLIHRHLHNENLRSRVLLEGQDQD